MTEAEWLIGRTLTMCDRQRELDKGEMLSLKKGSEALPAKRDR